MELFYLFLIVRTVSCDETTSSDIGTEASLAPILQQFAVAITNLYTHIRQSQNNEEYKQITLMKEKINTLEKKMEDYEDDRKQWTNYARHIEEIQSRLINLNGSCSLPIAFYARRNTDTVVPGGKTVDFKDVETDTCNTYNSTTSTFTCPSDGVYVFHYFALDHATARATYLQLRKNNVVVAHTWSRGSGAFHETGANTAILSLVKGDKVYITAAYGRPAKLHHGYTTFSGFKLN